MMPTALVCSLVVGSLLVWGLVIQRRRLGLPLVPRAPRRPVPWGERELVMLVLGFCMVVGLMAAVFLPLDDLPENSPAAATPASQAGSADDPPPAGGTPVPATVSETTGGGSSADRSKKPPTDKQGPQSHPIVQLLETNPSPGVVLLALLAAAVVVPISEELFFRVVLQGWLERNERRWLARLGPRRPRRGVFSIVVSSLVFAAIHWLGRGEGQPSASELEAWLKLNAATPALASVLTIVYLSWQCDATEADLGISWRYWRSDLLVGLASFLAVAPPVFLLQLVLSQLFPNSPVTLDPIPLFFLALALGYLYQRTHRLLPSVVLHFAVNAFSLLQFLVAPEAGP